MGTIKRILLLALFLLSISSVLAVQPTQQYNKIFLNPFYRASMSANTNYTYTLQVNPPDGISSVLNAIISFNGQINGQTQTFTLFVNGKSCNNPTYSVATAFSTTGNVQFSFDCSNIITKSGTYTLNFISAVNTGAMNGWLDLTYMNNPKGELKLHGTEYVSGEVGKMFLQFLDADQQPVSNSECFLKLWYPNDTIVPNMNYTLMSKLDNASEGIYYKNFNVPYVEGVYPASARCYRPLRFDLIQTKGYANDGFESNTWTGGTGWATCPIGDINCQDGWDVEDSVPLSTIVSTGCYNGTYCAKMTGSYGFIERGFVIPTGTSAINISFAFKFSGFQTNEHFDFFLFDGNWHKLASYGQAVAYGSYSNNVWYLKSFYLPDTNYELDGSNLIGWYAVAPSTGDEFFVDVVNIDVIAPNITLTNITDYQILRGSGEVHVSSLYRLLNNSLGANLSINADNVWSFPNRTLTYFPTMNTTTNLSEIPQQVWNYSGRNLTYYPPQIDMTNYTQVANYVWSYTGNVTSNILSQIATDIWNFVARYTHGEVV